MAPRRSSVILALIALQLGLLLIGVGRDYRLKHEDNNALHATFARSHLRLGLGTTRGQNYFHNPRLGSSIAYAHHPPAPALTLAVVFRLTGWDGPAVTRGTAVAFHVLATWLFYGLARRLFPRDPEVMLATLLFIVLPESSFFGRMMNHEVLVLPAAVLMVRGYWEAVRGRWPTAQWSAAMIGGATWAAVSGWAGFFAMGACSVHAVLELGIRRNRRARTPLVVLLVAGGVLFVLDIVHIVWVLGGDVAYLGDVLLSRMGSGNASSFGAWLGRVTELHWRYFGLTSVCALAALGYRAAQGLRLESRPEGAVEVGSIFLLTGAAYVGVFNLSAGRHDYWQFLLLPASAIAITLAYRWALSGLGRGRRRAAWVLLLLLMTFDLATTTLYTLYLRHHRPEAYCQRIVAEFRRDYL